METSQLSLTKSQLAETIITTLSQNKLGYKFLKANGRFYYFKRKAPNDAVTDMMIIYVYFRRGCISCNIQSGFDNKMALSGAFSGINRNAYIYNSQFDLTTEWKFGGPWMGDYCFSHSIGSLIHALHGLLDDLDVQGSILVKEFDERLIHPKFLCALGFIKQLTPEKKILINQINSDIINSHKNANSPIIRLQPETYSLTKVLENQLMEQLTEIKEKMESHYFDLRRGWIKHEVTNMAIVAETVGFLLMSNRKHTKC